jgi:putative oxidoreductase
MNQAFFDAWTPRTLAILRIVTGYLYIQHGTAKLFGFPHVPMFDNLNLFSILGVAGVLELVGGALLILGLFTRITAFLLSGEMAVAYFAFHVAHGGNLLTPILNQGELAILFSFVFLLLAAAGPGAWSIDRTPARSPLS